MSNIDRYVKFISEQKFEPKSTERTTKMTSTINRYTKFITEQVKREKTTGFRPHSLEEMVREEKENLSESRGLSPDDYHDSLERLKDHLHTVAYQEPNDEHLVGGTGKQLVNRSANEAAKEMVALHLDHLDRKLHRNPGDVSIKKAVKTRGFETRLATHLKSLSRRDGGQEELMNLHFDAHDHQTNPRLDEYADQFHSHLQDVFKAALTSKK